MKFHPPELFNKTNILKLKNKSVAVTLERNVHDNEVFPKEPHYTIYGKLTIEKIPKNSFSVKDHNSRIFFNKGNISRILKYSNRYVIYLRNAWSYDKAKIKKIIK